MRVSIYFEVSQDSLQLAVMFFFPPLKCFTRMWIQLMTNSRWCEDPGKSEDVMKELQSFLEFAD